MIDRKRYVYDFTSFERACGEFLSIQSPANLKKLQFELNKFFKDSKCEEVIYTLNLDKFFFGMTVRPVVDDNMVVDIVTGEARDIRIKSYSVEIDSKLLDLGLEATEFLAVLLHEVGHLVNDTSNAKEVKKEIDKYLTMNRDIVNLKFTNQNRPVLKFGISDALRKVNSIFTREDEEILADEFVVMVGYGDALQRVFEKIVSQTSTINKGVPRSEFIALLWTLDIYKNIKLHRLRVLRTLNTCISQTGSVLEKRDIEEAIDSIKNTSMNEAQIDYNYNQMLSESLLGKLKAKGLRSLQDDLFIIKMRVTNIEEEDEAIDTMRQINMRMALIDEYMRENPESKENVSLSKTLEQYETLRRELSQKVTYKRKCYGLWTDYNLIQYGDAL